MPYSRDQSITSRWRHNQSNIMKNNQIVLVVTLGIVAATALLLSVRFRLGADSLIGYVSVLTLLAVLSLEYRISWKWLFGR
ncbi:MAG: hypothetical protein EXS32_07245 [Opitutus sp.]|nr:hypothetical protein [Opitutus sp.]